MNIYKEEKIIQLTSEKGEIIISDKIDTRNEKGKEFQVTRFNGKYLCPYSTELVLYENENPNLYVCNQKDKCGAIEINDCDFATENGVVELPPIK